MHDRFHDHSTDHAEHYDSHRRGASGGHPMRGPGGPGFGPGPFSGPFGGPFGGRGRGPRARKGDVRGAVLLLLADGPNSGYGLIKAIAERTGGVWRPSPGSIYPTLQQLVDEGLITPTEPGAARSDYALTDEGRAHVEEHRERLDAAFGAAEHALGEHGEYLTAAAKLARVVHQVGTDATAEQRAVAAGKLDALRRELYLILAE